MESIGRAILPYIKLPFRKVLYCPKCNHDTIHLEVKNDEFFEHAAICTSCEITWEMTPDWKN